jgi:hypothetical protein
MSRAEGDRVSLPLQSLHIGLSFLETASEGGNWIEEALPILWKRGAPHVKRENSRKRSEKFLPGRKRRKTLALFKRFPKPSIRLSLALQSSGIEKNQGCSRRKRGGHKGRSFREGGSFFLGRSREHHLLHLGEAALIPRREEPKALHQVIEILHPHRQRLGRGIEIDHASPESMFAGRGNVVHPRASYQVEPSQKLRHGEHLPSAQLQIGIGNTIGSHKTSRRQEKSPSPLPPDSKNLSPGKPEGMTPHLFSQREFGHHREEEFREEALPILFKGGEMLLIGDEKNRRSGKICCGPDPGGNFPLKAYVERPGERPFREKLPESAGPGIFMDTQKPLPPYWSEHHGKRHNNAPSLSARTPKKFNPHKSL